MPTGSSPGPLRFRPGRGRHGSHQPPVLPRGVRESPEADLPGPFLQGHGPGCGSASQAGRLIPFERSLSRACPLYFTGQALFSGQGRGKDRRHFFPPVPRETCGKIQSREGIAYHVECVPQFAGASISSQVQASRGGRNWTGIQKKVDEIQPPWVQFG